MIITNTNQILVFSLKEKLLAYYKLLKPRLSFLVAFSAAFGYALASSGVFDWWGLLGLSIGGFLVSGASIMINQIIEKDLDAQMDRTSKRPIPSGKVGVMEARWYTVFTALVGLGLLLLTTNFLTVALAFLSMFLYGFVYTPLKRVGPIAVFVGAIPGALPPLLGWVGATGILSYEAWVIFAIQFMWQFPHFWAIAWVLDDDYKKAGFKMLPSKGGRNIKSAFQIVIYTFFLIPISLIPMQIGISGAVSAIIALSCGIIFLFAGISLLRTLSRKSALRIMFGSFLYLPIVQIAYLLDKI